MSKSKDKGTWAETAVAYYLQNHGWPSAERRALRGIKDRGDITGTPGVCWEVKYCGKSQRPQVAGWIQELKQEMENCGVHVGLVVAKTRGYGDARTGDWYAIFPGRVHQTLLDGIEAATGMVFGSGLAKSMYVQSEKNMAMVRIASAALPFVTTYSPGCGMIENRIYRVMVLRDAVTLLRLAGYGNSIEAEGGGWYM